MSEDEQITGGLNPQGTEEGTGEGAGVQTPEPQGQGGNNAPEINPEVYGAPEAYDFKDVQLPEGFEFDNDLAGKFSPIAKELNLSQQSANKLVNLYIQAQQNSAAKFGEQFAEYKKQESNTTLLNYEALLNKDAEIGGGDSAKMNAYLDVADKGYSKFASPELQQVLQELHLDYHPAVIKHFHALAALTGNDSILKPHAPAGTEKSAAEILYGSSEEG